MGCGPSRPPPENGFQLDDRRTTFRPPPEPDQESETIDFFRPKKKDKALAASSRVPEYLPPQYSSSSKAKEVARCAALLREMYNLDLDIWSMGNVHRDDILERNQKEKKADALFSEIRRILEDWKTSGHWGWKPDEWQHVEDIYAALDQHEGRRYGQKGVDSD